MTPIDAVMAWPWHKMLFAWAEARDMHADSWGLLLKAFYRTVGDE